jgi:hypothetical protein
MPDIPLSWIYLSWQDAIDHVLTRTVRKKDGILRRTHGVVESQRQTPGKIAPRTTLLIGELNDSQEATWRKTLDVFDEGGRGPTTLSLFPKDRNIILRMPSCRNKPRAINKATLCRAL